MEPDLTLINLSIMKLPSFHPLFSGLLLATVLLWAHGCASAPRGIPLERHELAGTYRYQNAPFGTGELVLSPDRSFSIQVVSEDRGSQRAVRYGGTWTYDPDAAEILLEPNDPGLLDRIGDDRYRVHQIARGVQLVPTRIADRTEVRSYSRVTHLFRVVGAPGDRTATGARTGGPRR